MEWDGDVGTRGRLVRTHQATPIRSPATAESASIVSAAGVLD